MIWVFLPMLGSPVLLSLWARKEWKIFRRDCPGRRVQFVITDIWAAALGLTPSFFIVGEALRTRSSAYFSVWAALLLALPFILGQFAGMFVYKLRYERRDQIASWKRSAGAIVLGAVTGLLVAFMTLISFTPLGIIFLPLTLVFIYHESGKSKHHK